MALKMCAWRAGLAALLLASALVPLVATTAAAPVAAAARTPTAGRLGGFDLAGACRQLWADPQAKSVLADEDDPFSWSCQSRGRRYPIDHHLLTEFAQWQYGSKAYAVLEPTAVSGRAPALSWMAYRTPKWRAPLKLVPACRWYLQDSRADQALGDADDPFSWSCQSRGHRYPITHEMLNAFAVYQHGPGAYAVLEPTEESGLAPAMSWMAYR